MTVTVGVCVEVRVADKVVVTVFVTVVEESVVDVNVDDVLVVIV